MPPHADLDKAPSANRCIAIGLTTPAYAACKADTLVTNSEANSQGTAFCLIETTGDMAGVTVQSVYLAQLPYDIVLQVTLWTNSA